MVNTLKSAGLAATFTSAVASASIELRGEFSMSLSGVSPNTVQLRRSFDDGSTWKLVATYTADAEDIWSEPAAGVLWDFNCATYVSGTVTYRLTK